MVEEDKKALRGDPRLHDATTPVVAASLEASAEAVEEPGSISRYSYLAPLVEIFEEQVEDTGYLDVINKLATVYVVMGRPQDAVMLFERCAEENTEFVRAWTNLAFTRLQLGLVEEAGMIFPRILKNRAASAELHNLYGLFYALQGNYPEAILEYERALTLQPQYDLANNNLALAYEALDQREDAVRHFHEAVSLGPLYRELGIFKEGKVLPEAVERFRARVQGNPLRSLAYYEAAFYYSARKENGIALNVLGEALAIEPDFARYYTALGFLEMNRGKQQEAEEHLEQTLAIDPGAFEAHVHLGFYYGESEKMDMVLDHFQNAVNLRPYYPDLHFNLGEALLDQGELAEAIACFRRALTINPFYGMALFKLGYTHQEAEQPEQAADVFARLKAIDPDFPEIDEFLEQAKSRSKPTVIQRKEKKV